MGKPVFFIQAPYGVQTPCLQKTSPEFPSDNDDDDDDDDDDELIKLMFGRLTVTNSHEHANDTLW